MRYLRLLVAALLVAAGAVLAGPLEDGFAAYARRDYATALRIWRPLALAGNASAQTNLGVVYAKGVPKDDQQAYFWLLLASVGGDADAIKRRDWIESRLTPQQRAAAQADARNWKPR